VVGVCESFWEVWWGHPRRVSAGRSDQTVIAIRTAAGEMGRCTHPYQRRRLFHFAKSNLNHKRNTLQGLYLCIYDNALLLWWSSRNWISMHPHWNFSEILFRSDHDIIQYPVVSTPMYVYRWDRTRPPLLPSEEES